MDRRVSSLACCGRLTTQLGHRDLDQTPHRQDIRMISRCSIEILQVQLAIAPSKEFTGICGPRPRRKQPIVISLERYSHDINTADAEVVT